MWSNGSGPSRCSLYQEEFTFGERLVWNACSQQWITYEEGSLMVLAAISRYSVGPIVTLHGRSTKSEYVDRLRNEVHATLQALFPNIGADSPDHKAPSTRLQLLSYG
jgi:hypothetical protein